MAMSAVTERICSSGLSALSSSTSVSMERGRESTGPATATTDAFRARSDTMPSGTARVRGDHAMSEI